VTPGRDMLQPANLAAAVTPLNREIAGIPGSGPAKNVTGTRTAALRAVFKLFECECVIIVILIVSSMTQLVT
jgi:hypothetical protein